MLDAIRARDRFLHYPYHGFSSFLRVLREAAISPDVTAIRMTMYRLARNSKVVKTLICAARNGKKVTVVIELLARFDEESNINWSKQMQDAGINVVFGMEGPEGALQTRAYQQPQGDVACISTGNFHEGNAAQYTDVTSLPPARGGAGGRPPLWFSIQKPYVPSGSRNCSYRPTTCAAGCSPVSTRRYAMPLQANRPYIMGKLNHITDRALVQKLYEASAAGVRIDLLVRGNCSLVTGIPGRSDNIRINGIIDRYLEHSRILIFANGGQGGLLYRLGGLDAAQFR